MQPAQRDRSKEGAPLHIGQCFVERDHGTLRPDLGRDGFGEGVKSRLAHCGRETRLPTTQGQGLGQPPMAFIYAVLFGASQSFLSPVGYQTNLMVFGPGRYRFLDIARYGLPLTVAMTVTVPFLICRYFGL